MYGAKYNFVWHTLKTKEKQIASIIFSFSLGVNRLYALHTINIVMVVFSFLSHFDYKDIKDFIKRYMNIYKMFVVFC